MYDYIKGTLTYTEIDHVVIENNGIGYRIFCANPMSVRTDEQKQTILYIHHHVREDAQILYGFTTREERRMFRLLLEVSGVGPKGALGVIASASPQQIALAIAQEDVKTLTKVPGIGPKTAKRVILDLKDKLKADGLKYDMMIPPSASSSVGVNESQHFMEALEALMVLGFQESEAVPVLKEIMGNETETQTDQLVRKALLRLNRF